jgi:peptidoglycan/LPS O-acetylase OafA/YrhL
MSVWFSLLGVGGIVISRDRRWSAWKVGLQAIGLWHILVVIAAFLNPADFHNGLWNWYLISVILVLLGMAALAIWMQQRRAIREATSDRSGT